MIAHLNALAAAALSSLAQSEPMAPWEGVQRAFRNSLPRPEGEPSVWSAAGMFVAALLSVVVLLYMIARLVQRGRAEEQFRVRRRFFAKMLKQLDVGWADRLLLNIAARHSGLLHPTVMLLTPVLWQQHAGRWADSFTVSPVRSYILNRVNAVANKAFPHSSAGIS